MKKIVRLTESDLVRIVKRVIREQITQKPEKNDEFLNWVSNATIMPFIAPNPYSGGKLKLGVQIMANDGKIISMFDKTTFQDMVINLMERMDVTTETGQSVYSFINDGKDGSGGGIFNYSNIKPKYEIIGNTYVVYTVIDEDSEFMQNLQKYLSKTNKFIFTVTPRLSDDILKTGSKLFKTKPNVLMISK